MVHPVQLDTLPAELLIHLCELQETSVKSYKVGVYSIILPQIPKYAQAVASAPFHSCVNSPNTGISTLPDFMTGQINYTHV